MNQLLTDDKPAPQLADLFAMLRSYVLGMWRFRWLALAVSWIVALSVWLFVYTMPDQYRSYARIYVDTENVLRPLLKGLSVETNLFNEVSLITRAISSRPSLEKVIEKTALKERASNDAEYERLLADIGKRISIEPNRQQIFTISFNDTEADTAIEVVQTLVDAFVQDSLVNNESDSAQAERTLKLQIDDYEQRLADAENRLKEFKQRNVGRMPGDSGDYYAQLQKSLRELDQVEQLMQVATQKREVLQRQINGSVGGLAGTPVDAQISQLEQTLEDLRIDFTDIHPEVVRTKSLLEDLRRDRQQFLNDLKNGVALGGGDSASENPVYQDLQIKLSNADVELAELNTQRSQKQNLVNRLRGLVDVIPQVEAEFSRLNRDYGVVRGRYEEMLKRWETLQTSEHVRSNADSLRFQVIDPPFVPTKPIGPARPLFILAGFILAVGAALGIALLVSLLKPVLSSSQDLHMNGFAVLGTIGLSTTEKLMWRRRMYSVLFGVGASLLVFTMMAAIVLQAPASAALRHWIAAA